MSKKKNQTIKNRGPQVLRTFSANFKRQKVKEIEQGTYTVLQVSRLYEVSSQSVYRWLYKYSTHYQKGIRQVIEMESESTKTEALMRKLAETERALGQKQLQIDYLEQLLALASQELGLDLKKSFDTKSYPTSTPESKKKDLR